MQLKGKKILIILTVLMYFATFLLQSNLEFFKVWAGETNKPRVNIVAVLVDDTIYGSIKGEISGYAAYIQQKLSDTKALVLPLHLASLSAYDIYRMMENIYFDGLKDVNSSLIGLVMIGDIPLPVVNNDGYVFPTVYPYVDFENQKYVWDSKQRYFVPNGNTEGQAEVWHGLINYGSNIQDYVKFFQKVRKYTSNPDDFIGDAMWYEDFIADKEGFLNENYQYYRNKLMFSEDLGYQRHSPLMKSLVAGESSDNGVDVLNELYSAAGDGENLWDGYEIPSQAADVKHSTKMIQQELKDSFLSDYNDLFSKVELTTKRENIFAGGRWIKTYDNQSGGKTMEVDADSSASMIQLKDTLYGGNDNLVGIIQNFNNLLERFVDKKIDEEKYSMDIVIPVEYKEVKGKRAYVRCYPFVTRYENYYFGTNARYVDNVDDLSIYRGTYRNLTGIAGLKQTDLLTGLNPAISEEDKTDITLKSVGASYDIFSNQADANRGYIMLKLEPDEDEYHANKTVAQDEEKTTCLRGLCTVRRKSWPHKCGEDDPCESFEDFTKRRWGGASVLNLDFSTVNNLRYGLTYLKATDAWRPIFEIAGFQSLFQGEDEGMTGTGWIEGVPVGPQWAATGYKAYQKYASPTQVEGWNKARWGFRVFENNIPNVHTGFVYSLSGKHENLTSGWKFRDYWELPENVIQNWDFKQDSEKYFSINHKNSGFGFSCGGSERYIYKFVSSVVKHVSTTDDQINGIDRDLYGESGRLGKYYADVLLAYSGLYQDTLDIVASGHSFVKSLSGKTDEMSGYRADLINAFSGLDEILNDDTDNSEQWGEIQDLASNIESEIPETLLGLEKILSGSRNDFMQLYMALSSLFADNIQGLFERIVYLELGDPSEIANGNYSSISTKVPFLSSWISKINSIKDLIIDMSEALLEAYDVAYTALDDFRSQRTDFYDRYQDSIAQLPTMNERFEQLNDGFVNIFRWEVEVEESDEKIVEEPGDEDVEVQEPEKFVVLTKDSAKEVVGDFMEGFEEIHKLFGQVFGTDQRGNKIIAEALNDKDFNQWARDNSVDVRNLSQSELITEYARWAEGPGYDSDGARKNHELLVGVVEHMDGMNILTSDRPIDSPRYVSMQSIEAKPLKLIYPDLFKVQVFYLTGENIHILYTGGEIRKRLEEYLYNKVDEYNTILHVPRDGNNIYYNKIFPYDDLATPYGNRPYKDFTYEEFVEALGGEQTLDMIADILYYQNLTNKKKLTSNIIEEDMAYIKKSFNINDKREYVLEDYLTEGREQEKNPLIVIPKYELSGYEVAYVNSNGGDYIIPTESITDDTPSQQEKEILTPRIVRVQPSDDEEDFKDKCKIPKNGKLPIFKLEGLKATSPWFEGFMCWVNETLNKPLEVKLSFDGSIGEIFKEDIKDEDIKDPEDKNYTKWKDDKVQTADARESLVNPGTGFDADKVIGELELRAERHNAEVLGKDSGASNALSDFSKNIKISNSNGVLSDNKPDSLLDISSIVNIGNITVTIEGTGDGCLKIKETTVCNGSKISETFNPKTNPFTGIVSSADNKAGVSALDIKYSLGNGGDYIEKVVKYRVSPSVLVSAKIALGDEKTVAGMITPVEVKGFDQYGNEVGWGLEKYDFKVSQGRFLKDGSFMTGFTTNDFRNLEFYYQAPLDAKDGSEAIIEIVKSNEFTGGNNELLTSHRQRVVQGNVEVRLNDVLIINGKQIKTDQEYKLSDEETIYNSQGGLDVSKLQKIDLDIKDMNGRLMDDLDSQIVVTSQNGLLVMGQLQKNEEGREIFFTSNMHHLSGGHVVVYFYPTKVAGKDVIEIEIPGLESRIINLNVRPSSLTQVQFKTSDKILQIGKEMTIEAFLMDKRGNLIDNDGAMLVRYDPDKVDIPGGDAGVVIVGYTQGYAKFTAIGIGGGLCYISTSYGSTNIVVDKHLFPNSGLNVLYLNYFGNDWGNQRGYFSDNDNYVESVMRKSNKVIATTTQIVSEDKIKKMLWKIQPGFQIQNLGNQRTVLSFHGKSIDMSIGEISSMHSSIPSLDWTTVTLEGMETLVQKTSNTNYMFFIPSNPNYSIKDGILYSGDKKLGIEKIGSIVDGEIPLQLSDSTLDNGDNVWNLVNRGISYGSVILHIPSFVPNLSNFVKAGDRYLISNTFTDGSTYSLSSVGFFDNQSNFELDSSYKSIQNSDELKEQIGFLGEFKNITLFAEGEIVGEATRKFGSEFVINLGDPVLSRKGNNENVYGTEYDGGIGQEIYADSEDDIFGTYQIDFNSDGLKDLLVVYLNGAIKLAKNYGGTPDMRNLQELMHIAVSIEDVYIGDVDGNRYEDIIIRTSNNQIRVYKNNEGVFDVDGSLACLNIGVPEGGQGREGDASDISELYQFEVEDMDKDKIADIITYDHAGYVKVFYGGKTLGGDNYLSKEKYGCDTGWYLREAKNTTVVAQVGLNIANGEKIFDNSMLRRVGMVYEPLVIHKPDLCAFGICFNEDILPLEIMEKQSIKDPPGRHENKIAQAVEDVLGNTDIDQASETSLEAGMKYRDVSLYENKLVGGDGSDSYVFVPLSFLQSTDKAYAYKTYSYKGGQLRDGDKVTVTVHIEAKEPVVVTFGDIIQGPWRLYFDDENYFKGLKIPEGKNVQLKQRDGNFAYLLDNISLGGGESFSYSYDLEYAGLKIKDMSLSYDAVWAPPYSSDSYPDVKMQSTDGCDKDFNAFLNMGASRKFSNQKIGLQGLIDAEYAKTESKTYDSSVDVVSSNSKTVNDWPGIVGNTIDRIELMGSDELEISDDAIGRTKLRDVLLQKIQDGGLSAMNIGLNINLSIFERQTEQIENVVDEITKGMCEGFTFGGSNNCEGLPVPFNQAFFAPGKYHLFGCWDLPIYKLDKGLPVFFFPGKDPVSSFPIPNGLKGGGDQFVWVPGGSYPSMIRIYAAPTLTAQLGIAVCLGSYGAGYGLPSPLSDVAGNCVVFAVKPKCSSSSGGGEGDSQNPNESYPAITEDVKDTKTCSQSEKGIQITKNGERSSPFNLGGSFFGIVELETSALIGPADGSDVENSITIGDVEVLGGKYDVNKIKGGIQQGLRQILIDKWLDPQIRYIVNQLTKMHINIKLPNIANLIGYEAQVLDNVTKSFNKEEMTEEEQSNNGPVADPTGEKKALSKAISAWKSISHERLNEFNDEIANPFEALTSLLNQSNIINITTEPLTVKVPFIMSDDITTYELYLKQWLDENKKILNEWDRIISALAGSCSKNPETYQQCMKEADEYRASLIDFEGTDWKKMENQIYTNLLILQQYRNFPFEMYEWIHAIDRYVSEIASLISNTIGYLSYWTSTNAERFVGYVDAIVLMLNIIKTYQIIIDFSVEWSQNCGNCARDTYDQYSCKLSLLCNGLSLPIIQIPNFKLPNITIDLTDIDLGLDIVLPSFDFQTVRVDLPELPNLPHPPAIGAKIKLFDLPNIPTLPEPPHLPELPSFIPEIELKLPILPPAPELPELPNTIEALIRVAEMIGKIYCIVKGNFGMVGESSVKAKIEQLTQRTYTVDWIDNIMDFTNVTAAPIRNYGVDYEIASHVDIQFNLSTFYSFLDYLTTNINNLTTKVVKETQEGINSTAEGVFGPASDISEGIDGTKIGVEATLFGSNGIIGKNVLPNDEIVEGIVSDDVKYVDYSSAKKRLEEVLTYFRKEGRNTTLTDKLNSAIDKIENQISTPNVIEANNEGIDKIKNQALAYVDGRKSEYSGLADMINNDYEGFLTMIDSQDYDAETKSSLNSGKLLTFNVNLFNLDSSAEENLKKLEKENPYMMILNNKQTIVDGYWESINKNSADDLGLTQKQYLVLRNDIANMKKQLSDFYSITRPASSTNLVAKNGGGISNTTLMASANAAEVAVSKPVKELSVDPSNFAQGIYEKIISGPDAGRLAKVVYADSFVSMIGDNNYKTSPVQGHDIVMWTDNAIFKKCTAQVCGGNGKHFGGSYMLSKSIDKISSERKWVNFDSDTVLKIADGDLEVKNWKVKGQTYDSFTLSWKLESVDAYLIKLSTRIDTSYEKSDIKSRDTRYILVLPDGVNEEDLINDKYKLEILGEKIEIIKSLLAGKQVVEVVHYDKNKSIASIIVSGPEARMWYYANIATLKLNDKTYNINSPRSNQIVAGRQIVGDEQEPSAEPYLYRKLLDKIVSVGDDLEGYVGTNYKLKVPWKDNVALSYVNISQDGKILAEEYTDKPEFTLEVDGLFKTESLKEVYNSVGIDQFGNKTEKVITVAYYIPTIEITDISELDGESLAITAELSHGMDQGNVSFQRRRDETWKTMKKKDSECADLELTLDQTNVVGAPYSLGNKIAFYNASDAVVALIDPETAEVVVQDEFKDSYEVKVGVNDAAVIKVCNKQTNKTEFNLSVPTEELLKVEVGKAYTLVDLSGAQNMGMYNGGKAVNKDGNNVLLVSPTGHLYSSVSLEGTYEYDKGLKAVVITLYLPSDTAKKNPIKVRVKAQPMSM